MEQVKRFYAWSPVIGNALAVIVVTFINIGMDRAGLPHVDTDWLIRILGLAAVPATFVNVSPAVGRKNGE